MDKPNPPPQKRGDSDLSLSELTTVTSNEADYSQSPLMAEMQQQTFFYDPTMAQSMYAPQNFNLQYQPTQNLYSIDTNQSWVGTLPQQPYVPVPPSSSPEQSTSAPVSASTTRSLRHDYVPLAMRPSIATSVGSAYSDGDEHSVHDEVGEKRRERRREQNRAAQRAFRARKEVLVRMR
jgi:hypothetical protein